MSAADLTGVFLLGALTLYVLLGGADFGAGLWSWLASGPRRREQRALIEGAIAPVWEANHVWLIVALVILFTGFPAAFRVLSEALHVPLELMLVGIVLRGSAFVFRQYGPREGTERRTWGIVFSAASVATPLALGVCVGAVTSGTLTADVGTRYLGWLAPFPVLVGFLTLALCAFLAAVYLAWEAKDALLRDDFRRRALAAGAVFTAVLVAVALTLPSEAAHFRVRFGRLLPLHGLTLLALAGAGAALGGRRFLAARWLAQGAVALMLFAWAVTQYPYVLPPDLTLENAAAPLVTLRLLLVSLAVGGAILFPSLYYLLKTFKS